MYIYIYTHTYVCVHTVESFISYNIKIIMSFETTWMGLKGNMLSETSLIKTYSMISLIYVIKKKPNL